MKRDYRAEIQSIRADMIHGRLSYDEAKAKAKPIIDEINKKAEIVARKFGKRFAPFTFRYLTR